MNNLCAYASVVHQFLQNTRIQNSQKRFHALFYFIFSLQCAGCVCQVHSGTQAQTYTASFVTPWSHVVAQKTPCNLDY